MHSTTFSCNSNQSLCAPLLTSHDWPSPYTRGPGRLGLWSLYGQGRELGEQDQGPHHSLSGPVVSNLVTQTHLEVKFLNSKFQSFTQIK